MKTSVTVNDGDEGEGDVLKIGKYYIKLKTFITLYISATVILSLLATGLLFGVYETRNTEKNLANKAMDVAQMTSRSPTIIEALEGKRKESDIQALTQKMQRVTGVRFIVVMDMHHIRKSHPNPKQIGKHFVGGDEDRAMHGQSYISQARGTLGDSLRAFVPIYNDNGKQIGVVSVGIMLNRVLEAIHHSRNIIYIGISIGLVIGLLSAVLIARKIKAILFGLEPTEISRMWKERDAMLKAVKEAILAINQNAEIVAANDEALRIFSHAGIKEHPIGKRAEDVFPDFHLEDVLKNGKARYDHELKVGNLVLVTNQVPFTVENETVGAVATFRDKTELKQLAEQLTGVKLYAESLRAQTHEFINHLHVILGLLHLGDKNEVIAYIQRMTKRYQIEIGTVSKLIKDPVLAGFLLSKMSMAREQAIAFKVIGDKSLPKPHEKGLADAAVTILGNLIDNAFDAVKEEKDKVISVTIDYTNDTAVFIVHDTGRGLPEALKCRLFEKGVSTKGSGRGYGLAIVKQHVDEWGGTISVATDITGTTFKVTIPWE
ncbi:DcuS/MalK family sensor histidine kinase [Tuberibacillus calidus]|uniref:DcuS/MalK family sensor histidine kinase n=1 Tax=Tuberibacillus calidus TaxID=340097 RepID=UPI00041664C1|nr:DcuS/MalK family sensor histidine kinase [Tuberibacillus calidus]